MLKMSSQHWASTYYDQPMYLNLKTKALSVANRGKNSKFTNRGRLRVVMVIHGRQQNHPLIEHIHILFTFYMSLSCTSYEI